MRLTGVRIVAYALTLALAAACGDEDKVATSDDQPTSGASGRCGEDAVAAAAGVATSPGSSALPW